MGRISLHAQRNHRRTAQHRRTATRLVAPLKEFSAEPALNAAFITDKTQEVLARALATAPSAQWSAQIIMDINHDSNVARLMPTYSVPGLIDHF